MRFLKAENTITDINGEAGKANSGTQEALVFKDRLEGLQMRWTEAWKVFWEKEELVVGVF